MVAVVERTVRACLITNPRSGHGDLDLSEALTVLRANGWDVAVRQKRHGGDATTLARAAAEAGCDVVVGCGGDGTLSEIVDGLAGSDVAVGVIPGGTVNLWAGELGVSNRPRVAALQLVTAERRRADLGHVSVNGRHGRYFLLMAGIGIDGAILSHVSKPLKQRIGPLAVGVAALQSLPAFRATPVRVEIDGMPWNGKVIEIVAGNTRRYGGFTSVTPTARIDDARLDLCLFTATSVVGSGRQAASLLLRGRPSRTSTESYRAARIVVQAPVVLPLQVDGGSASMKHVMPEADGVTYEFTTSPGAIAVLVPATYDGDLFQPDAVAYAPRFNRPRHLSAAGDACDDRAITDHSATHHAGGAPKEQRRRLRVTSVGVDSIAGVRLKNGHTLTVHAGAHTVATDAAGKRQPLDAFLSGLREGDIVRAKGANDPERDVFVARRLKLCAPEVPLAG
ncbi:MAG: diacylglycerol/lipid kinase family protein [Dehalococcoidia bacterium]